MKWSISLAVLLLPLSAVAADYTFSGRVVDDGTSQPLGGASVSFYRKAPFGPLPLDSATTTADGGFAVETNTPDTYYLAVSRSGYVRRTDIELGAFSTPTSVSNLEVRLMAAGHLSVQVSDAASGLPLANQRVVTEGGAARRTDAAGVATFSDLAPGGFRACAIDSQSEYLSTCVNGHALGFATSLAGPTVTVVSGQTTAVPLALNRGGAITGRIDDVYAGQPRAQTSIDFTLHDASGALLRTDRVGTATDGRYRVRGLPAGNYRLTAESRAPPHLARVLYRDAACDSTTCPFSIGALIAVAPPAETPNIDFALSPAAIATGRVTDAQTGAPVPGVRVRPYNMSFFWSPYLQMSAVSDADGYYELAYLPVSFDLRLGTSDAPGYVNLGWPSVPCGRDNCSGGTSFRLLLGEVRGGFDFVMTRGPAIRGRIVALGTTRPLSATVDVYNAANNLRVWSGSSDANGQYASSALPAGSYFIRASAEAPDWTCSWYGDALCPNEITPSDFAPAVPIATDGSTDTSGIDIGLRTLLILRNGFE